jgi:hypothetical protein
VADNNIDLTATFDTSNAIKNVKDFGKAAETSVNGINKSVSGLDDSIKNVSGKKLTIDTSMATSAISSLKNTLGLAAAGIAGYFSVQALSGFFSTMMSESKDAETNLNQLNNALARTGQFTAETSASMAKFATDLMSVSTIDDDVINGQLAIALNFTNSAKKAQELVTAAANLSAAMGTDLGAAVELLGRTLDGTAGRLNETVPALRGLSKEALQAGGAIALVGEQFAGAAIGQINTYQGAMTQLGNVFGNFAAALGNMIVQNPLVTQAIKEISAALTAMTGNIEQGTSASLSFVNRGLVAVISGIRDLLPSLNMISNVMESIALLFKTLWTSALNLVDGLKILGNSWLWLVGTITGKKTAFDDMSAAMDRIAKRSDELATSWANLAKNGFKNIDTKGFDEALKRIQDAANKKPIDISTSIKNGKIPDIKPIKVELDTKDIEVPNVKEEKTKERTWEDDWRDKFGNAMANMNEWLDNLQKSWEDEPGINWGNIFDIRSMDDLKIELEWLWKSTKAVISTTIPFIKMNANFIMQGLLEISIAVRKNIPAIFESIGGLVAAMGKGAEGARTVIPDMLASMMKGAGGAVGAIWGPMGSAIGTGIGGIIGEQIKLASGPINETMAQIDAFMTELPLVFKRITENLPTIMNAVMGSLPDIILALLKALPSIMRASASAMKPLFESIAKDSDSYAQIVVDIVWESISMIYMAIGYAIQGALKGFQKEWTEKMVAALNVVSIFVEEVKIWWDKKMNAFKAKLKFINFENFFKNMGALLGGILGAWQKFVDDIIKAFNFFSELFKNIGPQINQSVLSGLASLNENVNNFFGQFKIGFSSLGTWLKSSFDKLVDFFKNGIPNALAALVEGLRTAVNSLANLIYEAFKFIADGLIEGFKKVMDKAGMSITDMDIAGKMKTFGNDIYQGLKNGADQLFAGDWLKNIGDAIVKGFKDLFSVDFYKSLGDSIVQGFKDIFAKLDPVKAASGDNAQSNILTFATGGLSQIPAIMATGGVVPPGYPDDSYPSLLTSNEVVISSSTTPNLFSLIDKLAKNESQPNNTSIETNQLLKQLISLIASQQTQIDVKIDRDTLARAIISLNKDNRRLA